MELSETAIREAAAQGLKVRAEVVKALLPFRENTESLVLVFALAQCMRVLLRLYPKAAQKDALSAIVPYLEGRTELPSDYDEADPARKLVVM